MELKVHDLIRINSANDLMYYTKKPNWVDESITRAPFVVIRRVHSEGNFIPVGIRGTRRDERFAAFVHVNKIVDIISPEQIAQARDWVYYDKEIFFYLKQIENIMNDNAIDWGPVGSVGFELVSKVPTVNDKSDIDLMIRHPSKLTPELAKEIVDELNQLPVPTDIQVETVEGAFSLKEYAVCKGKPILFKTKNGSALKNVSSIDIENKNMF